jgi:hypothetical protein
VYNKIRHSEQWREVLCIAERGSNCTATKRLRSTDHTIDAVRVVHCDARTRRSGEGGRCLTGTSPTKD